MATDGSALIAAAVRAAIQAKAPCRTVSAVGAAAVVGAPHPPAVAARSAPLSAVPSGTQEQSTEHAAQAAGLLC
eukprot:1241574-Amphidinium_carterae.1